MKLKMKILILKDTIDKRDEKNSVVNELTYSTFYLIFLFNYIVIIHMMCVIVQILN